MTRLDWDLILEHAADVVRSYDTGVTLRQLFYRLVAAQLLPNTSSSYKQLSSKTAAARRRGEFPDLIDRGREIHQRSFWESPADAIDSLARQYRLDRTEGQETALHRCREGRVHCCAMGESRRPTAGGRVTRRPKPTRAATSRHLRVVSDAPSWWTIEEFLALIETVPATYATELRRIDNEYLRAAGF